MLDRQLNAKHAALEHQYQHNTTGEIDMPRTARTARHARTTCRYCDQTPDECTCTQEIVSVHTVLEELADGYSIENLDVDVDTDDQYWTTLDMRQPFWCETVE